MSYTVYQKEHRKEDKEATTQQMKLELELDGAVVAIVKPVGISTSSMAKYKKKENSIQFFG
ncbi:hypothetical protein [Cytobacillus gottheilii]|uniref:hypothetical protein n=1 Tax=Cytobacillus gottheilii TaxID=859144 RepID=UPI0009B9327D|nr:hypothetical protein [Cytobacillus gottheilii]